MSMPLEKGKWSAEPTHTTIAFIARHLGFTKVRGKFNEYTTEIVVGNTFEDSSIKAVVQLNSVDTGVQDRDNHLRSADFFGGKDDSPTMDFVSTKISGSGENYSVVGDLTINGKTLPVTLDVEFGGQIEDGWGNTRAGIEAHGEINRTDWGITFNLPVGEGFVISDKIKIEIDSELILAK